MFYIIWENYSTNHIAGNFNLISGPSLDGYTHKHPDAMFQGPLKFTLKILTV